MKIGQCLDVYLYSIDDLREACDRNRREREKEWPAAMRIVEQETARFMADLNHRATGPIIKRLEARLATDDEDELRRLLNKLPESERPRAARDPPGLRPADQQAAASAAGNACATKLPRA